MNYELVRVLDDNTLVDRDLCLHAYLTADGHKLEPGVYVVIWPLKAKPLSYDRHARFVGPFPTARNVEPLVRRCVMEYLMERRTFAARRGEAAAQDERTYH